MIEYTVIKSKRKTVAIHVKNGMVEVRCPYGVSNKEIEKTVKKYEDWIKRKVFEDIESQNSRESFSLSYGDMIYYLGNMYPIVIKEGKRVGFADNEFFLPPNLDSLGIINACRKVYKEMARIYFINTVKRYSNMMNAAPSAVKVSDAKKRWGSCSSKKSINLSWRLIMCEPEVVDYVIVHELAHIYEMNHSAKFWEIVGRVLPDYMERKVKLKSLSKRIISEGW